ncbi:MAG: hypothetical protein ABI972_04315 [Acidobacteriota bacterium]
MTEFNSTEIPPAIFALAEVLPRFEGDGLESQLQTFDVFLTVLSPLVRPAFACLLQAAAAKTDNAASRARIEAAAQSIAGGGRAAVPYNHSEAMRAYSAQHAANFAPKSATQPPAPPPASPELSAPPGTGRLVDVSEYDAVIKSANATLDPNHKSTGIGLTARWIAPDGRLVAWLVVRYFKGEEDYDHYASP